VDLRCIYRGHFKHFKLRKQDIDLFPGYNVNCFHSLDASRVALNYAGSSDHNPLSDRSQWLPAARAAGADVLPTPWVKVDNAWQYVASQSTLVEK